MMQFFEKPFAKTLLTASLGGAIALGGAKLIDSSPAVLRFATGDTTPTRLAGLGDAPSDFSAPAATATPAVVHIRATSTREVQASPFQNDPFFEFFNRSFPQQPRETQSSGSGVIIASNGHIVTNNHVVAGATELEVTLSDKRTYKARVIGTDPTTDLAVVKIEETNLPSLTIGNSDEVRVGQWVLAVGNPFNLESTVTAGIISAKGRNINILQENAAIESFLQTDAAVNPGNSGGALVNLDGELIGINTAIASQTGSYAGYSFAVPSNMMAKVVEDLIRHGKVQRAFLGISIRDVNGNLAKEKELDVTEGVYVDGFGSNSSAASAGVKSGDVILQVDEHIVKSVPELQEKIGRKRPGDMVKLLIDRKGKRQTISVLLKNGEGNTAITPSASRDEALGSLGADFENVPAATARKLGVEGGVRVKNITPGPIKNQTDMREGFIITRANRKSVRNMEELKSALRETDDAGVLLEGVYEDQRGKFFYGFGLE